MSAVQPSRNVPRAAWIMARAFTPHALFAPLALPWTLLSVIAGALRRGLFLDRTRTGMVLLYRSDPLLDVLLVLPIMGVIFGISLTVPVLLFLLFPGLWTLLTILGVPVVLFLGAVFLLPRGGGAVSPFGAETPAGPRWELAGLAQLPGTRLTGIQLARRVVSQVPPAGAVVGATAGTHALYRQYLRHGFHPGAKHRVYKVIGGPPRPTGPVES